jgi:hypothetical protein
MQLTGADPMKTETSRPEAAFVLLLLQATFWLGTALSAFPFALAGELFMIALGFATLMLAMTAVLLGAGLIHRRPRARSWTVRLEAVCLAGYLLSIALPIGANHGPVAVTVNAVLPLSVIVLIRGKRMRAAFA